MKNIKDTVLEIVSKAINGKVLLEDLNEETRIDELGINSMTLISILFEMENVFDFEIADMIADFEPPQTIGELININKSVQ